jgi:cytochrome c553
MAMLRPLIVLAFSSSILSAQPQSGDEFFENKIRPVIAANCLACHGKNGLGGLSLENRQALLKGGGRGPAVVPGDSESSLLIKAIRQRDELKMPQGGKLKESEIADFTEWVKLGAPWPESKSVTQTAQGSTIPKERKSFWSFQPLRSPALPSVKDKRWAQNNIDLFVLAKLESEGLKPVALADRRTLIRRVYFDLLGLPPSLSEVEAFVNDKSPDAYAELVDRLLAQPQYGERWARHWLDVVRFGEDDNRGLALTGYEPYSYAYIFRDWAIKSINDDMPFDVFLKSQLAGDQMDEDQRAKTLPGLGLLGGGPWYYDLTDPPVARADERHERVDTVTRAMLGLTVGCARCHDHKYDPITQRDYTALAGVFYNTDYHEYPLVPAQAVERWNAQNKKITDLQGMLAKFRKDVAAELAEVAAAKTSLYMMAAWNVTGPPQKTVAEAAADAKLDYELLERWIAFLARPPTYYPYLKSWQAMMKSGGDQQTAEKLANEFQDLLLDVLSAKRTIDEKNAKIIAKGTPLEFTPSVILPNKIKNFFDEPQLDLLSLTPDRLNLWTDVFYRDLSAAESMDPEKLRPGLLVFKEHSLDRQIPPEWAAHMAWIQAEVKRMQEEVPQFPFVAGVIDLEKPRDIRLHIRGNAYNLGDPVPSRFLEVLSDGDPKPFTKGSGRVELAESIVKSPITARVIVNRVWKWHFGTGIVNTPSNFGMAGERPSHPELLECLAKSFVDQHWSLKKLHREILLSASYQLGDSYDEASDRKDPSNRLHWKYGRHRMDAEQIRDSMLSISGALTDNPNGPSLELTDERNTRRTVYGRVSRFRLDTFLQVFDFPNPNLSTEGRLSTNVPLQRLFFLNSDFVYKQASLMARRLVADQGDEARVRHAYGLIFQRSPSPQEIALGIKFLEQGRPVAGEVRHEPHATEIGSLAGGPGPIDPDPLAAYVRVLLSSNEFLYVD